MTVSRRSQAVERGDSGKILFVSLILWIFVVPCAVAICRNRQVVGSTPTLGLHVPLAGQDVTRRYFGSLSAQALCLAGSTRVNGHESLCSFILSASEDGLKGRTDVNAGLS